MKFIFTILIIFTSFQVSATQDVGKVKQVFVFKTTYGFTLNTGMPNAASEYACSSKSGFASIPIKENTNSREMYAAILTAMASQKVVRINTNGCSGSHFRVSGVYVEYK